MAVAIRYALERWSALLRYCEDGRIEMDNNAAERALRAVALGRKNYLFAGSDAGGERAATIYSLLGSAKLKWDRSRGIPEFSAAAHCRSSHPPDCGTAAVESVSGEPAGDGKGRGMRSRPPQRDRAHNFRIVGTIRNETEELNLDCGPSHRSSWQRPLTTSLGGACTCASIAASLPLLHLPRQQYQELLDADSHWALFLGQPHPELFSLRTAPSPLGIPQSNQDELWPDA